MDVRPNKSLGGLFHRRRARTRRVPCVRARSARSERMLGVRALSACPQRMDGLHAPGACPQCVPAVRAPTAYNECVAISGPQVHPLRPHKLGLSCLLPASGAQAFHRVLFAPMAASFTWNLLPIPGCWCVVALPALISNGAGGPPQPCPRGSRLIGALVAGLRSSRQHKC